MNFTTIRPTGSNETTTETTTSLNNFEKMPQCDYSLLFSHLPLSFQFIQQQTLLQPSQAVDPQSQYQQQSTYKLCFALVSLLFGFFYSTFGYRFLKVSTFMIGFSLGSSVIYLILSEQKQLSLVENLIISLSIGVLFAFVALLVQYIGLFLLGITSSTSIVTCILIVIDLFYTNKSAWLCIGLLFICATLVASFTLKFQKSLTILNTSCIGCGLLLIAIDFFVENNLLIDYIYELYKVNGNSFNMFERQKALLKSSNDFLTTTTIASKSLTSSTASTTTTTKLASLLIKPFASVANNGSDVNNPSNSALALFLHLYSSAHARLCWYTWLIFGSYFVLLFLSLLTQFLLTGRNYDHRDSWHKLIKGSRKKKSANLEKIRLKSHLNEPGNSHHHHHHHHHHNSNDNTLNNHANQDLISESSLSRQHSDLEGSSQNDTLLLVESGTAGKNKINTANYTVSSTSENATVLCNKQNSNHISSSKSGHGHRRHHKSSRSGENSGSNRKKENEPASLEIVSFEVISSPKNNKKDKARSKAKQTSAHKSPAKQKENFVSASTSTTTSTSSSSSSTCQLIPIKLNNNDTNTSTTTKTTSTEVNSTTTATNQQVPLSPKPQPSAPPMINSSTPPPVPTLPPPKLPLSLIAQTTTSNSSAVSNFILNQPPTVVNKNLSKLKHHRSVSKDKEISSNDKFRYFYQVRRNNGDVLSQDFMNNIQNKLSSNTNINTNTNESSSNANTRSSSLSSSEKKSKKNSK